MTPQTAASPPASATVPSPIQFDELFGQWTDHLDAQLEEESAQTYIRAVRPFILWMKGKGITQPRREDILAYRLFIAESKKPATVQLYVMALRHFFKWLEREKLYENIAGQVKGAEVGRGFPKECLTAEQVKGILAKINRGDVQGLRDYAILSLMITTGLRSAEVVRADVGDIGKAGDSAVLYLQSKTGGEKTDYVKIPPPVEEAISEYLRLRLRQYPYSPLFASASNNSHGARITIRAVCGIIKARVEAAGYDSTRVNAQTLRNTAVALALHGGQPLQEVHLFARHGAIATTMAYVHSTDRAQNRCAETVAGAIF